MSKETIMADDRAKITNGPNERAVNENIAGTAPGIPDDPRGPCEEIPSEPSDGEVARAAKALGAPTADRH